MSIAVHARGDVSIIEMQGEFTLDGGGLTHALDLRGRHLSDLGDTLRRLLDQGRRKILLDLGGVTFLDSAGLGELVACKKRTVQTGGDIHLFRPSGKVRDLLEMLYLTRIFQVFDDEKTAIASFDG